MSEHDHNQDCQKILAQLYEYIDGELDTSQQAEIQAHLERCRPCLSEFEIEELFLAYVQREVPRPAADPAFKTRLLAQIRRQSQEVASRRSSATDISRRHWPRFAMAASIMLLVTVGAWWMAHHSGPPTCDWTKLASIHMNEATVGPPMASLETEDALLAAEFIAEKLDGCASIVPHLAPGGMLTREARVMPWKRHPIGQLEWRCPVTGRGASMFVSHASCLPLSDEPKVDYMGRCYRVATINGYHAICWKANDGFVCVMMAELDFDTILAWAEEVRQPGTF